MTVKAILEELKGDVGTLLSPDFQVEITETDTVPDFSDSAITYTNFDEKLKRCKLLESCVLFIDIRNSASMSVAEDPKTLARVYSSFIRSMVAAGRHFGGHVRDIIGDRVMVVFDREKCFSHALDTAILMNSIARYIIDKQAQQIDFRCGIGIDYGKMLITKAGAIRRGAETEFYRSLVWLGRPANIASRLTDIANKAQTKTSRGVRVGYYYPNIGEWTWLNNTYEEFVDKLEGTYSPTLRHKDDYFASFYKLQRGSSRTLPPILMTGAVYDGIKEEDPERESVLEGWWSQQQVDVAEYEGAVYGGDVIYKAAREI